jgi:hypothetical protein
VAASAVIAQAFDRLGVFALFARVLARHGRSIEPMIRSILLPMGFFDCSCRLSGVSLMAARTMLLPLHQIRGAWTPIALPIAGKYNRSGSIDSIEENDNTRWILEYFSTKGATNDFVLDEDYLRDLGLDPLDGIEQLLGAFERNIHDNPDAAVLNGTPVKFALFSRSVWQGVVVASDPVAPGVANFGEVFGGSPVASEIYGDRIEQVVPQLRDLATILSFIHERRLPRLAPSSADGQHGPSDIRLKFQNARRKFSACHEMQEGLSAYEREIDVALRGGW